MDRKAYNEEKDRYDDTEKKNEEQLEIGEVVACVWQEDGGFNMTRYLGING